MKISDMLLRLIVCALALVLTAQFAKAAPLRQQAASNPQSQDMPTPTVEPQDANIPKPSSAQDAAQIAQTDIPQSTSSEQHQNPPSQPVGTAAAPYEKPIGVAASRPAGAVIAPGKQRREHAIIIRVAIVAGAAVALGTVVALSHSTSGRP
jgi:hypothetical protein